MGTRNLTIVVKDNEYKVAQYCQWDGYPSGQGTTVLDFVKTFNKEHFEFKLSNINMLTKDQIEKLWIECGAPQNTQFVSIDVCNIFKEKHPSLHRDTGANILDIINNSDKEVYLENELDFAGDSLFCEWAYVIDLDNNCLEVYCGFNHTKLEKNERFYFLQTESDSEYYPVKLIQKYDFTTLPTKEEFIKSLEEKELN